MAETVITSLEAVSHKTHATSISVSDSGRYRAGQQIYVFWNLNLLLQNLGGLEVLDIDPSLIQHSMIEIRAVADGK